MLKYTTKVLFLHLAPWITTLEKEETIPIRIEERIYYKNTAFLLYKHSINWQRRPRLTHQAQSMAWPAQVLPLWMLPQPLPSCSSPSRGACLLHHGYGTVLGSLWKEHGTQECLSASRQMFFPPLPQATVLQLCPRALWRAQNWEKCKTSLFTRHSWETMILCWISCSFPSQTYSAVPQEQKGMYIHHQDKRMAPTGLQEGWCGALCFFTAQTLLTQPVY